MRNSIAAYKETLSRLANGVHEELQIPGDREASVNDRSASPRRRSRRFSQLSSPTGSPPANGSEAGSQDEIAQYKADIQKLQASEAEIKALSFNYAAMLKEKEEQLSKLREENGSLRRSLEAKDIAGHVPRNESPKTLSYSLDMHKETGDRSPTRPIRYPNQVSLNSGGNNASKSNVRKQNGHTNKGIQTVQFDCIQDNMDPKVVNLQEKGKEHSNVLEEKYRSLAAVHTNLESEIKELRMQLKNECENATMISLKLQEEHQLNKSSQKELYELKKDKERTATEIKELQTELNERISELRWLEVELNRRNAEDKPSEPLESLKNAIAILEQENAKLKIEKDELAANLELCMKNTQEKNLVDESDSVDTNSSKLSKVTEEMEVSIQKLQESLKDTSRQRDKALQDLERLKQHLLEKEMEDSDKMDEDSKIIEELRANSERQQAHISQLERALKQELAKKEGAKKLHSEELQKANEMINGLRQEIVKCMSTIDAKNVELLNLQTALGQYYAESEAKERLARDLAVAKEESAKLSELLKVADQGLETSKREKEELISQISQVERLSSDNKRLIQKLEEDNSKLRRALEHSMTTLNRMSLDSDNYVDRRIVIKLLVTYFQRNHSKEVLDLMVRMLGFSEEDKQRIGFAQHGAGKGVVRGVLGLPGRLVGGILGGNSPESSSSLSSGNQSFADLWVDFLLKETEERERREASEAAGVSSSVAERSTSSTRTPPVLDHGTYLQNPASSSPAVHFPANHNSRPVAPKQNQFSDQSHAEFSTVPLVSSVSVSSEKSSYSRLLPRH